MSIRTGHHHTGHHRTGHHRTGHHKAVLMAVAVTVLGLAGPVWPVAAAPGVRDPGVPPPVNPAELPTPAEVLTMPYLADTAQTGGVRRPVDCVRIPVDAAGTETEPPGQQRLRIEEAHLTATGLNQVVAVIDSGVSRHPRLSGRLLDGGDYIEGNTGLADCDGHGTAVAGIVAAAADPSTKFVGMAPDAKILSIRQGSRLQRAGDTESLARAVVQAVNLHATVINISEAACFPATPDQVHAPDLQAAVHHAVEHDVVVVVAAANLDAGDCRQNTPGQVTTISSPAWFDEDVLTVAATDESGDVATFSMHGPWVDVAAPGSGAVSLAVSGPGLTAEFIGPDGTSTTINGTSFATPYVAGLAALVREKFPELTAREVMHRIEQTAQRAAGGPGKRSEALGHGVINPVAALTDVLPEERGAAPAPAGPAYLEGIRLEPPDNPLGRQVALIGSAVAIGLLGITLLVVYTVRWRGRNHPP